MREPAPEYSSRQYDRPNRPWVCGLACEGQACPAGPTARGQCPALAECVPAREGDRWKCNRSMLRGGECAEGPTPEGACGCVHRCRPVRSLRTIRGRFVATCVLLIVGGMFVLFSGRWRDEVISPGPLTSAHAQLLADGISLEKVTACAACHAAGERSVGGWAVSLVGFHGSAANQSMRCMECHHSTISRRHADAAHSVDPMQLREITVGGTAQAMENKLACSTCHHEHQGADFNLTMMGDAACQACHQARYESFSTDHPGFGKWPYERRTRIAFNHASHQAKHFAEKKMAFACRTCHVEDATRAVQLTASYEVACASCHDEKIAASVAKGVPMFVLPTLDVEALRKAGHDIGPWPEDATGEFGGRLPSAMKLLLASDPSAAKALELLGADFEFADVDPDDASQLAACADLAKAMRELIVDLGRQGTMAVRERLQTSLGPDLHDAATRDLLAGLTAETVHEAARWLSVDAGDNSWPQDNQTGTHAYKNDRRLHFDRPGLWTVDDATLSVRYEPAAHADPVLTSWLELLASVPHIDSRPIALAMFKELSSATAAGTCASCHSVEDGENGRLIVNWRAFDRTNWPRTLTRFSHGPHMILPQLADCTSCHAIDNGADTSNSYASYDPHASASEFAPVSKQDCATCHTAKLAGESCQTCHNYHVDVVESWRKSSRRGADVAELRNTNRR